MHCLSCIYLFTYVHNNVWACISKFLLLVLPLAYVGVLYLLIFRVHIKKGGVFLGCYFLGSTQSKKICLYIYFDPDVDDISYLTFFLKKIYFTSVHTYHVK